MTKINMTDTTAKVALPNAGADVGAKEMGSSIKEANIKELARLSELVAKAKDAKPAEMDMARGQLRVAKQYFNMDEQAVCIAWLKLASDFVSSKLLRGDQDPTEQIHNPPNQQ